MTKTKFDHSSRTPDDGTNQDNSFRPWRRWEVLANKPVQFLEILVGSDRMHSMELSGDVKGEEPSPAFFDICG